MWTVKPDHHADGCISVLGTDEAPVVVALAGRYPQCVSDDGRDTKDCPHVLITIYNGYDGQRFYNGVVVEAVGKWAGSKRRVLAVYSDIDYSGARNTATHDQWVDIGKSKIDDAVRALDDIDALYDAEESFVARARKYDRPLSRDEYEAACGDMFVPILTENECMGYGVRYMNFSFPEYPAEHVVKMMLAHRRMQFIDLEAETEQKPRDNRAAAIPPSKQGQLWEPCQSCGQEPVHMPLHLCDECWPRGASA